MCLSVPAEVTKILPDDMAIVSVEGVSKEISIVLVDDLAVGDYVLVHVGYALARIDPEEAKRTVELLQQLSNAGQELQS
ncbi:HypC/HybG/HupF family hydrogenase formation chaperone [Bradyrhizobium neotropicale]|uniref:HypC/HybG/HupF family hydrogenase formation chaperone n=1 Tax=Bradyrhizobium neotropicale TaxID=1497615 RepID=UPI001AD758BA|nr:HypC/HybG/HupF family hydrogenase formation chaperone [Bradyrhizobium neotropicale]MBO4227477.1 HypC/HybG/HupF family hydrogenase formation chaperone [Bradyrhizobium neotropicale]